jgi:hypothetical protein
LRHMDCISFPRGYLYFPDKLANNRSQNKKKFLL